MLICYDLDGTLVDSTADIRDGLRAALAVVPPVGSEDEAVLALAGFGLPLEAFFARARGTSHGPEVYARFVAGYRAHYDAHLLDRTRPFPGIVEMLGRVRAHPDVKLAVATTKRTATARRIVDGLGLTRYFDLVLGSDGLEPKPAPDVLIAIADALAIDRTGGILIGDTTRDIAAARAAGMRSCGVLWGETGEALRAAGADAICARADELDAIIFG